MSFGQTTYLGGSTASLGPYGPALQSGGNFNPAVSVSVGQSVLVAINIAGATSVAGCALAVTDTQGNSYSLLGQVAFGSNLFAVFGSAVTKPLQTIDYIGFTTNSEFYSTSFGLSIANCTINVDFVETGSNSGTSPSAVTSGTPGSYGDMIVGFTAMIGALNTGGFSNGEPSGPSGWDTQAFPIASSEFVSGDTPEFQGIFAAKTFSHSVQTYNPTFSEGITASFGTIVVGLTPQVVTGVMAAVEHPDFLRVLGGTQADPFPPQFGPFFFAYVEDADVEFDPNVHARWDENIFSFDIQHDEGQVPTLEMSIQNPREGLLSAGRKTWAYLSYQSESGIIPLFFGVLVGIPSDMFAELITVKFNARSPQYIDAKQAVAETLRVAPYYDPVFLDEAKRDDPDAVLEGWSSLYHVDRVTLDVTASDILEGEDGTITFDETTHPLYDSVKMEIGESPLFNVQVQGSVKWTQRCIGYIDGPPANISSYTGGSFKSDWPKPGANIGGGWKCEFSYVTDVLNTEHARSWTYTHNWKNTDPDAGDCSTASTSVTATYTSNPGISIEGSGTRESQTGICNPGIDDAAEFGESALDLFQNQPATQPAKMSCTGTIALQWILNCVWSLRYDAKRDFNETVIINMTADLQSTLASPTIDQDTELIKVNGADVGLPLRTPYAWSSFINQNVGVGTVIYPNDPTTPGGTAWQICVGAGTAGPTEPTFSDIPGTLTQDSSVTWASLGDSPPQDQPEWTSATPVAVGEIFSIEPKSFDLEAGDMQTTGASYFFLCVKGGTTNGAYTEFEYLKPAQSNDDGPQQPVPFAVILGPGDVATGNLGGGGSGAAIPATGGSTTDGSVVWVNLGTTPPLLPIPIGGTMTNVVARSYFPSDRGAQSIQYLIAKARARLRMRARAIKLSWDAPFDYCLGLSCRMNATLYDPRLPGGVATGKVISYTLSADKDGKLIGHVEIGVCVGNANSVAAITGTPEYTDTGDYMDVGYQAYDGGNYVFPEEDIAYTEPVFQAYDDGLVFPLQSFPGTLTIVYPDQNAQLTTALAQALYPQLADVPQTATALKTPGNTASQVILMDNQSAVDWLNGGEATYLIECDPVAAEVLIQPVTNGPFNGAYNIAVSPLELPKGIDLDAPSSP